MGGITLSSPTSSLIQAASAATLAECMAQLDDEVASTIVIVPSYAQQRHAVSAWAASHGAGRPPMVMPMATFTAHVADAVTVTTERHVAADEAQLILDQLVRQGNGFRKMPGLDARLLQRFETEGVTADGLPERPEYDEVEATSSRRLRRLQPLWKAFRDAVDARGHDTVSLQRSVIRAIVGGAKPRLFLRDASTPVDRLVVRDVVSLTVLDRLLLRQLATLGWDIAIHWAQEPPLRDGAADLRFDLHDVHLYDRRQEQQLELVRDGWTHVDVVQSDAISNGAERSFPTIAGEIRSLLAIVKLAVRQFKMSVTRIAIVVPDMQLYEGRIRDVARGMGIPLTGGERANLLSTSPCGALLTACDVMAGGWRRIDLDRLRRTSISRSLARALHDVVRAGQAQRMIGGNGGLDWQMTLVERLHAMDQRGIDPGDDSAIHERRKLRDAVDSISQCQQVLPDVSQRMTAHEVVSVLFDVVEGLGLDAEAAETQRRADEVMRPCCDVDAVRVIKDVLRRYVQIMADQADALASFDEHRQAIRSMLEGSTAVYADVRLDGVSLLSPAAARGRRFDLVLSPGWVEGVFPAVPRFERVEHDVLPFLRQLDELDMAVDVLRCVEPVGGRLLLSWPGTIDDTETLPSQLLGLVRGGVVPVHDDPLLHADADRMMLSVEDLRLRIGPAIALPTTQHGLRMDDATAPSIEALQRQVSKPVSPTHLDAFTSCPYAYAAKRLYGLQEDQHDDDALTAKERGAVMHEIVHELFRTLRIKQHGAIDESDLRQALEHPIRLVEFSFEELRTILHDVAGRVLDRVNTGHAHAASEARMLLGNGVAPGLLDRWLYMEYRQAEQGAPLPAAFEVEIAETLMLDDAHIDVQLRVDRIDYDPTSEPARLVVIDYKNSKDSVPSVADVAFGRKLQMPLYVHAVNCACQRSGINATVESAQYIPLGKRLHDADAARRILRLGCDGLGNTDKALKQPFEETMANIDVALVDVVTQLRQASFPVRPRSQACAHCSYNELCRIESFGTA